MTKSQNTKNEQQKDLCITSEQLTEQWKKGKLEEYKKYYCKTKWFEDVFQTRCYNKDTEDEWWALENEKYRYNNIYHIKDIEVLAPVPSYDEWQASEKYNKHLEEVIKVYERKDKQATETSIAYNELAKENEELKELLKECREHLKYIVICPQNKKIIEKLDQALGEEK